MDVERLIALVKEQPVLYDGSYLRFRDREALSAIWQTIATKLNANENDCRDKWHNLRSNYMRVRRKEKMRRPGSTSNPCRKWAYYDKLSFLYPYTEEGMCSTNASEKSPDNSVASVGEDNSDSEIHAALQQLERDASRQCGSAENIPVITIEKQPCETKVRKLNSHNYDHQYFAEAGNTISDTTDESASDRMFLLSLLPFIKQLEPVDNLDFRLEVQQILRRKLYPPFD